MSEKQIKLLDIGCGSGYIRKIFHDIGYRLYYTGLDIKKHRDFEGFNGYALTSNFVQSKIEDFSTEDKYDIVFSICALEHIEDDFLAVSKSDKFLKEDGLQIHIVPTSWSLFLYLKHGHRRYTKARLEKMFKRKDAKIYRLGGFFSFLLHFFFITVFDVALGFSSPRRSKVYSKLLRVSNKLDYLLPIFSCLGTDPFLV